MTSQTWNDVDLQFLHGTTSATSPWTCDFVSDKEAVATLVIHYSNDEGENQEAILAVKGVAEHRAPLGPTGSASQGLLEIGMTVLHCKFEIGCNKLSMTCSSPAVKNISVAAVNVAPTE